MDSKLELYYYDSCPFCYRVLTYLDSTDIKITLKNTLENPTYREELLETGGKTQVPCLVIDGAPLYESEDIINWLEKTNV